MQLLIMAWLRENCKNCHILQWVIISLNEVSVLNIYKLVLNNTMMVNAIWFCLLILGGVYCNFTLFCCFSTKILVFKYATQQLLWSGLWEPVEQGWRAHLVASWIMGMAGGTLAVQSAKGDSPPWLQIISGMVNHSLGYLDFGLVGVPVEISGKTLKLGIGGATGVPHCFEI